MTKDAKHKHPICLPFVRYIRAGRILYSLGIFEFYTALINMACSDNFHCILHHIAYMKDLITNLANSFCRKAVKFMVSRKIFQILKCVKCVLTDDKIRLQLHLGLPCEDPKNNPFPLPLFDSLLFVNIDCILFLLQGLNK